MRIESNKSAVVSIDGAGYSKKTKKLCFIGPLWEVSIAERVDVSQCHQVYRIITARVTLIMIEIIGYINVSVCIFL